MRDLREGGLFAAPKMPILNRVNGQNEVLMEMNTCTDCNIVAKGTRKRARIECTVEPNKFYLKIS